jgi:hypothetical protein
VAGIAIWNALQIILVFGLSLPEGSSRRNFSHDFTGPEPRGLYVGNCSRVINLRLATISRGGPAAELETRLMVTEKMKAALDAAGMLARGASTRSVISFYRSHVRSNVRRLTRKAPLHRRAKRKVLGALKGFAR